MLAVDADAPVDEAAARAREQWLAARNETVQEAAQGIELITASSVKSAQRPLAAQSDTSDRPGDGHRPPAIDTEGAPPLELGDAFHRVMELVDLPDADNLEPLAQALCLEAGIPESAGAVVDMARLTLGALSQGMAARRVLREVPFVVPDGDRMLVGRIDLVADRDGDGEPPHVVDFKTDARHGGSATAAAAHHAGQVETYRTAVRSTLDGRAVRLSILFARTGELADVAGPS